MIISIFINSSYVEPNMILYYLSTLDKAPKSLQNSIYLIFAGVVLHSMRTYVGAFHFFKPSSALTIFILGSLLNASIYCWVIKKLLHGYNWMRIAYTVLITTSSLYVVYAAFLTYSFFELPFSVYSILSYLTFLAHVLSAILLFHPDCELLFKMKK